MTEDMDQRAFIDMIEQHLDSEGCDINTRYTVLEYLRDLQA